MANHPPYSVGLTYLEDRQEFSLQAIDRAKLTSVVAGLLEIPVLLDEHKFNLDDAFARRLGAAMLALIALGQPAIEQYMNITKDPIE